MSQKPHEAPAPVGIAAWATAVVGAFVLAVSVGLFVYNTISAPIAAETCALCPYIQKLDKCYMTATDKLSKGQITQAQHDEIMNLYAQIDMSNPSKSTRENTAKAQDLIKKCEALISGAGSGTTASGQTSGSTTSGTTSATTTGQCPTGSTQYAINNYPMTSTSAKDDEYFEKMGVSGDSRCYRCSDVCVPQGITLRGYLDKLSLEGGEKITVLQDKAGFDALVGSKPSVAQKSAVILSSLKGACEGPISIDYPGLIYDGKSAVKAAPNDRCTNFWKRQKKAASSAPSTGGTTGATAPGSTQPSIGAATQEQLTQPSETSAAAAQLNLCWTRLRSKYPDISRNRPVSALLDDIDAYLKGDTPNANAGQLLEKCQKALKGGTTEEPAAPEAAAPPQAALTQQEKDKQAYELRQSEIPSGSSLVQIEDYFYAIPTKLVLKKPPPLGISDNYSQYAKIRYWTGTLFESDGSTKTVYIDRDVNVPDGGLNPEKLEKYKIILVSSF